MFTTNSGEAVPGLAGLSGTILVTCLILMVIALIGAVIAVGVRRRMNQSQQVADALLTVVYAAGGAAVIAGAGAAFLGGSTLYQVPKVEAQKAEPAPVNTECSESRTATISSGVWEDQMEQVVELPELEQPIVSGELEYWPDPNGCDNGTVDPCRMVHLTGTTGDPAAMTGFEKLDEWIAPKGECSDGDPEQKDFS